MEGGVGVLQEGGESKGPEIPLALILSEYTELRH